MTDPTEHAAVKAKALEAVREVFRAAYSQYRFVDGLLHYYEADEVHAKAAAFLEVLVELAVPEAESRCKEMLKLQAERDEKIIETQRQLTDARLAHHEQIGALIRAVKMQSAGAFADSERLLEELEALRG